MKENYNIEELVQRVKKNDLLAMKILYNSFAKEMLSLSFRVTKNRQESEDILQESFLASFQKIGKLTDGKKYKAWLKRIVVNNSINAVRKVRHFEDIERVSDFSEGEEDNWYEGISFDTIKAAILLLPDGCREIFTLYLLENYKHREIAEMLQISVSTSKSQYRYALQLLKQELKKHLL